MWVMVFTTAYITITSPDNVAAVLAAAGGQFLATANYMYRRHVQKEIGEAKFQSEEGKNADTNQ